MAKTRVAAPVCLGQRMAPSSIGSYFMPIPQTGERVRAIDHGASIGASWSIVTVEGDHRVAGGIVKGQVQAAANAATRWLINRAELTLKLASRRAA